MLMCIGHDNIDLYRQPITQLSYLGLCLMCCLATHGGRGLAHWMKRSGCLESSFLRLLLEYQVLDVITLISYLVSPPHTHESLEIVFPHHLSYSCTVYETLSLSLCFVRYDRCNGTSSEVTPLYDT